MTTFRLHRPRSPFGNVLRAAAGLLLWLASQHAALAGSFTVSPMRLELGAGAHSAAITLRNEDRAPLSFNVRGMAWLQDDQGQEQYEDTKDLIYFPRLLTIEPGQQAVIRLGLRQRQLTTVEKTYRLFVEELPPVKDGPEASDGAAQVHVLVRFGAPIFVAPHAPASKLVVEHFGMGASQAHWTLRNEGNRHELFEQLVLSGLDKQGEQLFSTQVPARYFLAGRSRRFSVPVPPQACAALARLLLQVKTDKSEATHPLDVAAGDCS